MEFAPNVKPLPYEIREVREQAIKAGLNPDKAEKILQEKMNGANAKITDQENARALDLLAKSLEKRN